VISVRCVIGQAVFHLDVWKTVISQDLRKREEVLLNSMLSREVGVGGGVSLTLDKSDNIISGHIFYSSEGRGRERKKGEGKK